MYGNDLVSSGGETLLSDGVGATRQTTSSSQGVVWSSAYTAFGQPIAAGGSTGNHYQWGAGSGYRSDGFGPADALPLTKVGCRYYDPEFGCFLSRDTVLSQSPYVYCDGDPVNNSDPSGHWIINIGSPGGGSANTDGSANGDAATGYSATGQGTSFQSSSGSSTSSSSGSGTSDITGGVKTQGLTSTVSLTSAPVTLTAQENNGHFVSAGYSGSINLFGPISVTFGGTANVMPSLDQASLGVAYRSGGFMAGLSESSTGVTMLSIGYNK